MKVLIVFAHPEPASLNGSLKDFAVSYLQQAGHEVIVSDLYHMRWKAVADANDFLFESNGERFFYERSSQKAFSEGLQQPEIEAEQKKLLWADFIIFQFPIWWYATPAILKGWIDRVYAYGFTYGVGKHEGKYWGKRFGEGKLEGKKAMLSVTAGGREPQYQETGVNGNINDLLFPVNHGVIWYPGIAPLPPFVVYNADSVSPERYQHIQEEYRLRLQNLTTTDPIPYRFQNNGDYDDQQQLKEELIMGKTGFALHVR